MSPFNIPVIDSTGKTLITHSDETSTETIYIDSIRDTRSPEFSYGNRKERRAYESQLRRLNKRLFRNKDSK